MKRIALCGLILGLLLPATARADSVTDKLGEAYASATPVDKLKIISTALADKVFKDYKERRRAQELVDELYLAELKKGESSAQRLQILGDLRRDSKKVIGDLSRKRMKEKKRGVWPVEPDSNIQAALALSYVLDTAGAKPTLESLSCLATVRDNTSWGANGALVLSFVLDALSRDKGYAEADHLGKMTIIKGITEKKMISDQERKHLGKAILAEWLTAQIKAGKSAGDILLEVKGFKSKKLICWFTASWAEKIIERLPAVR